MKKLILHIGRHKSGTSSIQSVLAKNPHLLDDYGYYYPVSLRRGNAHHLLAEPLARSKIKGKDYKEICKKLGTALFEEVENEKKSIILSSEAFQNCNPEVISHLFNNFQCRVIVYLREQSSYLRSAYLQKVQATCYSEDIETFYNECFSADYNKFLENWTKYFDNCLEVKLFEQKNLYRNDIVFDFFQTVLDIPASSLKSVYTKDNVNPSICPRILEYKKLVNSIAPFPEEYRLRFYRILPELSNHGIGKFDVLPAQLSKRVVNDHVHSNNIVANKWFNKSRLFEEYRSRDGDRFHLTKNDALDISLEVMRLLPEARQHVQSIVDTIQ